MKVVIFTGGTGSRALQDGFNGMFYGIPNEKLSMHLITNAYDNGLSTGEVRKVMNGKILGPSDVRKNQLYQHLIKFGVSKKYSILEKRITCKNKEDIENYSISLIKDLCSINPSIDAKYINIFSEAICDFFSREESKLINYADFSFANILYAGLASTNNYSLISAKNIMAEFLEIPLDLIELISDDSLFLQAITESNSIILDEGIIVDWNNEQDKIKDIRLVDIHGNITIPEINEHAKALIKSADIIIFSSGTQWSSLIPTYIHKGFRDLIEKSNARKYLVMNNVQDKDMKGLKSNDTLDILGNYLPLNDITIVFNKKAHPDMFNTGHYSNFISETLSTRIVEEGTYDKLHNGNILVKIIMSNFYKEYSDVQYELYDFDGTLVDKGEDLTSLSADNLFMLKMKYDKCAIVTGNSLKHVNSKLKGYRIENPVKYVFCDGGNSICEYIGDKYEFVKYVNVKWILSHSEIDEIFSTLLNEKINIPVYKLENRNNLIISVKPFSDKERIRIAKLLNKDDNFSSKYEVHLNGRTTIDICKKGYDKTVIFDFYKKLLDNSDSVFAECKFSFVGDELKEGNDECISNYYDEDINLVTFNVNSIYDTHILLRSISQYIQYPNGF